MTGGDPEQGTIRFRDIETPAEGHAPAADAGKRVLFVTAEPAAASALRSALLQQRSSWHVAFARSAAEALAELGRAPFDAIVSELHLPHTDGAQLLAQVRELHPNVVRLCLSDGVDEELFLRAVPVTHQFLRKPCSADNVREVVERACSVGGILHNEAIRELIGKLQALPATPQTFEALSAAIARPTAHAADISNIVSNDRALCVKTLQIVNSALFRRTGTITSIQTAVSYVGMEMLKSLAMSACVFHALDASPATGKLLADLQARSIRKARFARLLLEGSHGADEAFTAALLLDVGQAVLALSAPAQFERMVALARERDAPWHEIEPECFGVAHPEVGACLLGLWGLPLELIEAVAHHHCPSRVQHAQTRVLAAVHVADAIVDATADQPAKLLDHLDAAFVARSEVARCLSDWNIDPAADTRSLQRTRAA
ncbi:MAG TPA: response regulator [Steroidobacteraceae bacterium]|nr:response regulator [Steroidobacteraceae bacterium]